MAQRRGLDPEPGPEGQHVPALRVPAQEPRGAVETGVFQTVEVRDDRQGLRLVRAADCSAHPHHTVGDIARRQEFDVGRSPAAGI
ncbi:hypothetical protein NicSoilB4_01290 [Arthrobacter sp. NicSoilB4]|uniref:hypothetical protein n=1 Tax=Arthrobacter sp. NicSoilB4 TaxID=2830997 RepID=UPI001CC79DD4|nr:hypothetical protein [Arthrobacter sp. NicSoilB4]BCW65366.1 hypothetical protein NicSoilB4_01290 [Arthrobacter sp. NicSoilB4]